VPIAISAEQRALAASIREWAARAGTLALVRGLEPGSTSGTPGGGQAGSAASPSGARGAPAGAIGPLGSPAGAAGSPAGPAGVAHEEAPWAEHWAALAGLGIFSIALPGAVGGDGGTVADLAAAQEQLTVALVPGPVMPTLLAGLLLRGHADLPAAKELLPALATGQASVAVALATGTISGDWLPDGTLRVSGETGLVLGGGATSHLLLGADTGDGEAWFLLPAGHAGVHVRARAPVDFSRSLADITLTGAVAAPGDVLPGLRTAAVRDMAATLMSAEAAGVAGHCCATAAGYARTRHQFGRPIGSFQAVKHLCAGMLCRAESAAAAAWDAARAADDAPQEHPLAAAAAAALALDAAVDNAKDCIQVLGGIGFTWEHDAHLYLRRALALRQLLGGSAAWRARAGQLALAGARRRLALPARGLDTEPGEGGMGRWAGAARAVAAEVAGLPEDRRRAALAGAGYVAPQWPAPYGLSAPPAAQLVIDTELSRAGITRPDLSIGGWAAAAVVSHGSPAQRERFAGPTLRGEITWCQLFSEPDAGSDLASVRTRGVRAAKGEAGGWRLTGQKVWTSLARDADWAICLARTDSAAPKHRGLTYFLVDMHSPGIEIRPLREITGRAFFNEVFLDEVFVPDDCVVGECGDGWRIARSTLASERTAMGRGSALGDEVETLIAAVGAGGRSADPAVAGQVGAVVASGLAGSLMDLRAALAELAGTGDTHQAAVRKLVGVAHRQAVAETALVLTGPDGAASDGPAGDAVYAFLLSRCLSIAGGTSQILLSVVAERALGLPRDEAR
jgi:3-oxochol-4-en-24-oyl-CoA dehydrogenase